MRVREDAIERPDGSRGIYGVVEKPDFVAIAAIDRPRGLIHLVEQYRYPVSGRYWELPQGSWETRPDVPPEEVARAELSEETGIVAGKMTMVGDLFPRLRLLFAALSHFPGRRPRARRDGPGSRGGRSRFARLSFGRGRDNDRGWHHSRCDHCRRAGA